MRDVKIGWIHKTESVRVELRWIVILAGSQHNTINMNTQLILFYFDLNSCMFNNIHTQYTHTTVKLNVLHFQCKNYYLVWFRMKCSHENFKQTTIEECENYRDKMSTMRITIVFSKLITFSYSKATFPVLSDRMKPRRWSLLYEEQKSITKISYYRNHDFAYIKRKTQDECHSQINLSILKFHHQHHQCSLNV